MSKIGKSTEGNWVSGCQWQGLWWYREWGVTANGHRVSLGDDISLLEVDNGNGYITC